MALDKSTPFSLKRTFLLLVGIVPFLLLIFRKSYIPINVRAKLGEDDSVVKLAVDIRENSEGSANSPLSSPLNTVSGSKQEGSEAATPVRNLKSNAEILKVPWTSVGGQGEKDSFHLFSAYYDNRSVSLRPAVIVLGYSWNEAKKRPLYCKFKYQDGHTECLKKPLEMRGIASCMAPNLGGLPYFFYCPADQHFSPVSVSISEARDCNQNSTSKEITISNTDQNKKPTKKFGICIGGPIIENENILQDLNEFISINKILGAEVITIYVMPNKVSKNITDEVLRRYSDVLRLIEWRSNLEKWSPIHYYGQYLLAQDCLYRSMYEVEYLFHQDIDEVFIPVVGNNWAESVPKIPGLRKGAVFKHQNYFFSLEETTPSAKFPTEDCGSLKVPKYLKRTKRLPCFPGWNYRSKPMTKPRFTLELAVHDICAVVPGYTNPVRVPRENAFLGHFRSEIPKDCRDLRTKPIAETWATKYTGRLHELMCNNRTRT